jgi:hypothetical protein
MPNFTAPTLIADVQTAGEIRQDLNAIQTALIQIQNALPSVSGASVGQSNLTWVERALVPDGMIGVDSFFPSFSTDMDSLVVEHRQEGDFSSCVISGLYHQTQETFEKAFSDIITGDGTFPVVFAAKSMGYPSLAMKVLVEDTDNDYDLLLYRMDVTRSGSTWLVQNLRREATVLLDRGAFAATFDADFPLAFGLQGAIGTGAGQREAGVIAPWDCEVVGAYLRLGTAPTETDGLEIEIRRGEGTDAESVCSGAALWSAGDGGTVMELSANTPQTQVSAGEWLHAHVTVGEAVSVAADLYVTVLVRRIWHPIYR